MQHVPSQLRFWLPTVGLVWLDLWSKAWIFKNLPPENSKEVIAGVFEFRRSLNDGAVFGSFTGYVSVFIVASLFALAFVTYLFAHSRPRQWVMHVALAMILAGALGNLYDRIFMVADIVREKTDAGVRTVFIGRLVSEADNPLMRVGDWPEGTNPRTFPRSKHTLERHGVVRDFIKFVPPLPAWVPLIGGHDAWPWVFNVADAVLVCGVIILLLHCLFERRPRDASE